jgi:hypothetical protein
MSLTGVGRNRFGIRLRPGVCSPCRSTGDSYDNALAETVNGSYKAELIYGPARDGPWKTVEDDRPIWSSPDTSAHVAFANDLDTY